MGVFVVFGEAEGSGVKSADLRAPHREASRHVAIALDNARDGAKASSIVSNIRFQRPAEGPRVTALTLHNAERLEPHLLLAGELDTAVHEDGAHFRHLA